MTGKNREYIIQRELLQIDIHYRNRINGS